MASASGETTTSYAQHVSLASLLVANDRSIFEAWQTSPPPRRRRRRRRPSLLFVSMVPAESGSSFLLVASSDGDGDDNNSRDDAAGGDRRRRRSPPAGRNKKAAAAAARRTSRPRRSPSSSFRRPMLLLLMLRLLLLALPIVVVNLRGGRCVVRALAAATRRTTTRPCIVALPAAAERIHALSRESTPAVPTCRRRSLLRVLSYAISLTTTAAAPMSLLLGSTGAAHAADDDDRVSQRTTTKTSDELSTALRPATDDRPQIPLPSSGTSPAASWKQGPRPSSAVIAEGLVYYGDPRGSRPYATDTLLITVESSSHEDPSAEPARVLAGAKLPLNQIRLPLRFQLTTENLLLPNRNYTANLGQILAENDLIVRAMLCPEDTVRQHPSGRELLEACQQGQPTAAGRKTLQASAVAKLLRLPQLDQPIRAPVSLPLEWK